MNKKNPYYNRAYPFMSIRSLCLFCGKKMSSTDSFKNINSETGEEDYFHIFCFRSAVNKMIRELRNVKSESEHGEENR